VIRRYSVPECRPVVLPRFGAVAMDACGANCRLVVGVSRGNSWFLCLCVCVCAGVRTRRHAFCVGAYGAPGARASARWRVRGRALAMRPSESVASRTPSL
jgi:hypothetical protein